MRFCECFTIDLKSREDRSYSTRELLHLLVFDAGYRAVAYYRLSRYLRTVRFPRRICGLLGALLTVRLTRVPGVEIRARQEIGPGLKMFHPHDIVIGVGSRIGRNVTIYNGVTLGARTLKSKDQHKDDDGRYPTIEDGVTIFPGAKIIGPVTIGANSIVGANAVVFQSFPASSVIAGVPARRVGDTD